MNYFADVIKAPTSMTIPDLILTAVAVLTCFYAARGYHLQKKQHTDSLNERKKKKEIDERAKGPRFQLVKGTSSKTVIEIGEGRKIFADNIIPGREAFRARVIDQATQALDNFEVWLLLENVKRSVEIVDFKTVYSESQPGIHFIGMFRVKNYDGIDSNSEAARDLWALGYSVSEFVELQNPTLFVKFEFTFTTEEGTTSTYEYAHNVLRPLFQRTQPPMLQAVPVEGW